MMIREINDGDRTGYLTYMDKYDNKKVGGAIHVNGVLQRIGECKYIELDDNNKVIALRKEMPTEPKKKKTVVKKDK